MFCRYLSLGMSLLALAVACLGICPAARGAPRNIVLIVSDDQGPDLGCYGNAKIKTPRLDALAAAGVRFTRAFCTTASCSASRSVILTGLYNHANAQYGHEHSYHHFRAYENLKSLPVLLSAAGYRTARIGKLHVGPPEVFKFEHELRGNARNAVEMAENCRELLAAKDERPFFLYFCPVDPHRSGGFVPDDALKPNPFGNVPRGHAGVNEVKYGPQEVEVPSFLPDTPTCRAELAQYAQSVSRVDQGVGRLVDILKETGRHDDTLVVFTSDHGIAFPGAKTTLYEGGMHIPFLVSGQGVDRAGGVCHAMITLADLAPTLLDFAGALPEQNTFHGRSFLKALREERPTGWNEVYASHTFHEVTMYYPMRVVRTERYKLIWNIAHGLPFPFASDLWEAPTWQDVYAKGPDALYGKRSVRAYIHRPRFELYDLETDPHEIRNLAQDQEHAPLLAELQARLKAFQKRTSDPWISKWDYE